MGKMNKKLSVPLIFLMLSAFVRHYRELGMGFVKIKSAGYYLRSVQAARQLCMGLAGIVCIATLLVVGILLFQISLVLLLPIDSKSQIVGALSFGILDIALALGILIYFFSGKRWLKKAINSNETVKQVLRHKLSDHELFKHL